MVLGLPIGRIVGQYFGWRTTFFAIGMGALVTGVSGKTAAEAAKRTFRLTEKPAAVDASPGAAEHLSAYRYCGHRPLYGLQLYRAVRSGGGGFSGNFATLLLLLLGGAGIIGSILFGKLGNQHASALVSSAIGLLLACLLLLMPAAGSESQLAILSLFWGVAIMIIGLGMQVKVLALAPDATDVAMSLFSGILTGIGAGALVGNQVILHVSMSAIGYLGPFRHWWRLSGRC